MDTTTVKNVAHLARIAIDDDNISDYQQDLSAIFTMIDQLDTALAKSDVHIDDLQPLNHPLELIQRLRDDVVTAQDHRSELMKNAPEQKDNLFIVPTVID